MSKCPQCIRDTGDGIWVATTEEMSKSSGQTTYRIDAATKVWPVPVTYSVEWFDNDRKGDNPRWRVCAGPSNVLAEIEQSFDMRRTNLDLLRFRIIDSTGNVIREWKPKPVTCRMHRRVNDKDWIIYDECLNATICKYKAREATEVTGSVHRVVDSTGKTIAEYRREVVEVKGE